MLFIKPLKLVLYFQFKELRGLSMYVGKNIVAV
jgi:hypothetical protein